jgi:predicted Zn-dependent protease
MLDDVIEKAQAYGAHESEVFWQETSTGSVRFEDSRLKSVDSSESRGMNMTHQSSRSAESEKGRCGSESRTRQGWMRSIERRCCREASAGNS